MYSKNNILKHYLSIIIFIIITEYIYILVLSND